MTRIAILTSLLAITAAACSDDGTSNTPPVDGAPPVVDHVVRLNDDITTNTTFTADNTYIVPRLKYVFVKNSATLTIEPGTVIKGEQGGVLVVTRGAKIMANGTAEKPIVLTSAQADGQKTAGFWGGLLVLGNAPINTNHDPVDPTRSRNDATFEAFTSAIPEGVFGGTDPHDSSGVLRYVRIEFAGFNFVADREFNNLTLCGVGDGTMIDFVQVHGGSDDGIELFGGTVNVKHLVSSQNQDDGFDTDNGWVGKAQFVIVQNVSHPATLPEASNGYESDNHADPATTYVLEPRTEPTIYNVTLIGDHPYTGTKSFAAVFRRGTAGHYFNHLWFNFPLGPEFRDAETLKQLDAVPARLEIKYSMFFHNDASPSNMPPAQDPTVDIVETAYINATNHDLMNTDPGLPAAALSKTAPSFLPIAGGAALDAANAVAPPSDGFFDPTATFVGAVGPVDWTSGWTKYPQN
jgi:hypothetical protein